MQQGVNTNVGEYSVFPNNVIWVTIIMKSRRKLTKYRFFQAVYNLTRYDEPLCINAHMNFLYTISPAATLSNKRNPMAKCQQVLLYSIEVLISLQLAGLANEIMCHLVD